MTKKRTKAEADAGRARRTHAFKLNGAAGQAAWIRVAVGNLQELKLLTLEEASCVRGLMTKAIARREAMLKRNQEPPVTQEGTEP